MNPYQTLGVLETATPAEVKSAYRRLARRYHPDINPTPEAALKFRQITSAYETLDSSHRTGARTRIDLPDGRTVYMTQEEIIAEVRRLIDEMSNPHKRTYSSYSPPRQESSWRRFWMLHKKKAKKG